MPANLKYLKESIETETEKFLPSVDWLKENYNLLNSTLFNGRLGDCDFDVKNLPPKTLGRFSLQNNYVKANSRTRKMFIRRGFEDIFINPKNFAEICQPLIEINALFIGSKKSWLSTLLHEMCHYYVEMQGYYPKQGHGPEFRKIATYVSNKSNNLFPVERIASAEQMSEFQLDSTVQKKRQQRTVNKMNKTKFIFIELSSGEIKLVTTSQWGLINLWIIKAQNQNNIKRIIICTDPEICSELFDAGYRKDFRTLKYYPVKPDLFKRILGSENEILYQKENPAAVFTETKTMKLTKRQLTEVVKKAFLSCFLK